MSGRKPLFDKKTRSSIKEKPLLNLFIGFIGLLGLKSH